MLMLTIEEHLFVVVCADSWNTLYISRECYIKDIFWSEMMIDEQRIRAYNFSRFSNKLIVFVTEFMCCSQATGFCKSVCEKVSQVFLIL